jgi:ribonuclease VapC
VIAFDSSAVLAAFFNEPGQERVRAVYAEAMMSIVNAAETLSRFVRDGQDVETAAARLAKTPISLEPFDWQQARIAAGLEPVGRSHGLSLGDRACLALAIARDLPVLTADRAWAKLAVGVEVRLIR